MTTLKKKYLTDNVEKCFVDSQHVMGPTLINIKYSWKQQKVNELSIKSDIKLFIPRDVKLRVEFGAIQHRHIGEHYSNSDSKHCINMRGCCCEVSIAGET